ncbi:amino acid permease [Spiroplasma tabanidicola]|uniref:Amino acid permease n=1 Tax=Spiroplasma tabanidicola TaxID=324079 RepID=A0A6I6CA00_9MOLU|nr:amino acid permease [Spiroplasma tabanidicola]QGS52376.1 amino acid permease [Spiroplasma tabanidicola]
MENKNKDSVRIDPTQKLYSQLNNKKTRKSAAFDFWRVFSIVFGNSIGVGIYLKSKQALLAAHNPYIVIIVLFIMAFVGVSMVFVFIELATSAKNRYHTHTSFAETFIGRRTGSLFSLFYCIIYIPVYVGLISITVSYYVFRVIDDYYGNTAWINPDLEAFLIIFIAVIIIFFMCISNGHASNSWFKYFHIFFNNLKFVPLLFVIGLGIYAKFHLSTTAFVENNTNQWKLSYFILVIPMLLFELDGFMYGSSIEKEITHKRMLVFGQVVGVILVVAVNVTFAVALYFGTTDADSFSLISALLSKTGALLCKLLIAFVVLGSVAGFSSFGVINLSSTTDNNGVQLVYYKKGNDMISYRMSGYINSVLISVVLIVISTISWLIYRDSINRLDPLSSYYYVGQAVTFLIDKISDSVVVMAFTTYLALMLAALMNHKTKKVDDVLNVKGSVYYNIIASTIMTGFLLYIYYDIFKKFTLNDIGQILQPLFVIIFSFLLLLAYLINEIRISKVNIDENDFVLKINPKNWTKKYDKTKAIQEYKIKHKNFYDKLKN